MNKYQENQNKLSKAVTKREQKKKRCLKKRVARICSKRAKKLTKSTKKLLNSSDEN